MHYPKYISSSVSIATLENLKRVGLVYVPTGKGRYQYDHAASCRTLGTWVRWQGTGVLPAPLGWVLEAMRTKLGRKVWKGE